MKRRRTFIAQFLFASKLRLGKPAKDGKIYIRLRPTERSGPKTFLTGCTADLRERLMRHNSGTVRHTAKWKPWRLKTYIAFADAERAAEFERYLKTASGRALLKKRL